MSPSTIESVEHGIAIVNWSPDEKFNVDEVD